MKGKRFTAVILLVFIICTLAAGCGRSGESGGENDDNISYAGGTLKIISGSENKELEPILE